MSTNIRRRHRARASILIAAMAGAILSAGAITRPMAAYAASDAPDIEATATFDKPTYTVGQDATVTFTLRNIGTADATNLHITGGDISGIDISSFPVMNFNLAAGAVKTVTAAGTINAQGKSQGFAFVGNQFEPDETDADLNNNIATARATVAGAVGDLAGFIFHEADNDPSTVDDRGVAGVVIKLYQSNNPSSSAVVATTDAKGEFTLQDLPVGPYTFTVVPPSGWKLGGFHETNGAQVSEGTNERVLISLVPVPVSTTSPPANAPQLPQTGSPTALIAGIGAGAVAVGVIIIGLARRRRHV